MEHTIICESCGAEVRGDMFHLGFSDMDALYCSSCARVLLLSHWQMPDGSIAAPPSESDFQYYNRHLLPYWAEVEALFRPCGCGGSYAYMNPPRCPVCSGLLRGDLYEDKPILKQQDRYVFVCAGSVAGHEHVKREEA